MGTISKTKSYAKVKNTKLKLKNDATWQATKTGIFKVLMFVGRWIATTFCIYLVSMISITGLIPFTVAYLAGQSGMSVGTDAVTSVTTWVCPSVGATIIISIVTAVIDVQIYKFFKKQFSYQRLEDKKNDKK